MFILNSWVNILWSDWHYSRVDYNWRFTVLFLTRYSFAYNWPLTVLFYDFKSRPLDNTRFIIRSGRLISVNRLRKAILLANMDTWASSALSLKMAAKTLGLTFREHFRNINIEKIERTFSISTINIERLLGTWQEMAIEVWCAFGLLFTNNSDFYDKY